MRVKLASIYHDNLKEHKEIMLPNKSKNAFHVYHQYTINSKNRNKIKEELEKNNIGSAIYYPISLEKQKAYKDVYNDTTECANSNYLSNTCLSLPMYPQLSEENVIKVCEVLKRIKWVNLKK